MTQGNFGIEPDRPKDITPPGCTQGDWECGWRPCCFAEANEFQHYFPEDQHTIAEHYWYPQALAIQATPPVLPMPAPVPEPSPLLLLAFGLAGLVLAGRKR